MRIEIDDALLLALCRHPAKYPEECGAAEDVRRQVEFCVYEYIRKLDDAGLLDRSGGQHLRQYQRENVEFIRARKPDKIEERINES